MLVLFTKVFLSELDAVNQTLYYFADIVVHSILSTIFDICFYHGFSFGQMKRLVILLIEKRIRLVKKYSTERTVEPLQYFKSDFLYYKLILYCFLHFFIKTAYFNFNQRNLGQVHGDDDLFIAVRGGIVFG